MHSVEVLVIQPVSDDEMARIAAVDSRLHVIDARRIFACEYVETWSEWTVQRYVSSSSPQRQTTREERDHLLATAEIILGGWPYPLDLCARATNLKWFHQRQAGASNLRLGDLWESHIQVTTSRGYGNTLPMAEYVLASFFHFARGLHVAYRDQRAHQFQHRSYRPVLLEGKTVCVVGAGGIGRDVGRVCARAGMRVVGTRRQAHAGAPLPDGFERLEGAEALHTLLSESDFVAICCQWTPETTHLIDAGAFAAMRPGTILANIARGEIIDEAALLEALQAGKLRGVALDVYDGEFEHAPDPRLWDDERVLMTPHVSGGTDVPRHQLVDLFCQNLRAYLDGQPLVNRINWQRGY
jgi:phosphoglycerate dehydrogenase-like enzyme